MKYLLETKAGATPKAKFELSFVEDSVGELTDEVCFNFNGYKDFELCKDDSIAVLNEKDLHSLIGMLLQVQQKVRNRNAKHF